MCWGTISLMYNRLVLSTVAFVPYAIAFLLEARGGGMFEIPDFEDLENACLLCVWFGTFQKSGCNIIWKFTSEVNLLVIPRNGSVSILKWNWFATLKIKTIIENFSHVVVDSGGRGSGGPGVHGSSHSDKHSRFLFYSRRQLFNVFRNQVQCKFINGGGCTLTASETCQAKSLCWPQMVREESYKIFKLSKMGQKRSVVR